MRIAITPTLSIDSREIEVSYILASGPGGQNVNKVATAAQLRFNARGSPSLPDDVKLRLEALAGSRLTNDGVIVLTARRFRSQERNRADALTRLTDIIRAAAIRPTRRRPTKPSRGERERRLSAKAHRATTKRDRGGIKDD
jgi:ribosome-associated protein